MAVSPLLFNKDEVTETKVTATKVKSLAVRQNSRDGSKMKHDSRDESEPEPEVSDRLNAELREKYVKDKKIGEGTYANVYKGHLKDDPQSFVAIKKIKIVEEYTDGIAMDAIREIKFLQELDHPNIIALHAVFLSKNINLVLEFLPLGDLEALIKDTAGVRYGSPDIKAWMGMLGRGIWFCHEKFVLHRDIKPNNLMIAADGEIKLADFGLARSFADPFRPMSTQVITRWYRPPELFYGAQHYSGAVDMWSVGLVFAELVLRTPYINAMTDVEQVERICQAIGTPTEENWPGVTKLPNYVKPETVTPVRGRDHYMAMFGTLSPLGVDLLMTTLTLDPRKRVTAKEFLQHKWWASEPRPTKKEDLPRKAGGAEKMGSDLGKKAGQLEDIHRGSGVARKLDFGANR